MDYRSKQKLSQLAESLLHRNLSEHERYKLAEAFDQATGSTKQRALAALAKVLQTNPREIQERTASSDNADRLFDELLDLLQK